MNRIFLVLIHGKYFYYSEEKFWNFCKTAKNHDWFFWYGEIDSNEPLKSPKDIPYDKILDEFNLEKIKPLLKYKIKTFGSTMVIDAPFFKQQVYKKYGERIGWNDKY